LWNEIVREAVDVEYSYHVECLREIRHLYIDLHQGTDAAPTAFDASTDDRDSILNQPSSYLLCNIPTHHPHSTLPLPTQLDDQSHLEGQPIPDGNSRLQHAEEPSFPDYAPRAQESRVPLPSLITDPVHIPPQPTLATVPSVQESFQTFSLDLTRLVSALVSHFSLQSSLSTANLTTNIVPSNQPTGHIPTNEMGESSQTTTATLLAHPHPRPVPATVTPIVVRPPSVSMEQGWYKHQDITGAPVLDADVTTSVGTLSSREHYETRDPNPPTPMNASLQVQQREPSTPS